MCTQLSGYLKTLKGSSVVMAWEKLFISCVALHSSTVVCCPPLSLAGTNKGLTGRAWRSWLLDGKGESHSWAGQASSLAKVMSCVHWDSGWGRALIWHKCFFLSLWPPGLVRRKAPGAVDKVQGVSETKGWWLRARQEVEILSKWCVCIYVWARLTAPEAFTPAASSALF